MSGREPGRMRYPELERIIEYNCIHILEIAKMLGIATTTATSSLYGRREFKLSEAKKLANHFGMPVEKLFKERDE